MEHRPDILYQPLEPHTYRQYGRRNAPDRIDYTHRAKLREQNRNILGVNDEDLELDVEHYLRRKPNIPLKRDIKNQEKEGEEELLFYFDVDAYRRPTATCCGSRRVYGSWEPYRLLISVGVVELIQRHVWQNTNTNVSTVIPISEEHIVSEVRSRKLKVGNGNCLPLFTCCNVKSKVFEVRVKSRPDEYGYQDVIFAVSTSIEHDAIKIRESLVQVITQMKECVPLKEIIQLTYSKISEPFLEVLDNEYLDIFKECVKYKSTNVKIRRHMKNINGCPEVQGSFFVGANAEKVTSYFMADDNLKDLFGGENMVESVEKLESSELDINCVCLHVIMKPIKIGLFTFSRREFVVKRRVHLEEWIENGESKHCYVIFWTTEETNDLRLNTPMSLGSVRGKIYFAGLRITDVSTDTKVENKPEESKPRSCCFPFQSKTATSAVLEQEEKCVIKSRVEFASNMDLNVGWFKQKSSIYQYIMDMSMGILSVQRVYGDTIKFHELSKTTEEGDAQSSEIDKNERKGKQKKMGRNKKQSGGSGIINSIKNKKLDKDKLIGNFKKSCWCKVPEYLPLKIPNPECADHGEYGLPDFKFDLKACDAFECNQGVKHLTREGRTDYSPTFSFLRETYPESYIIVIHHLIAATTGSKEKNFTFYFVENEHAKNDIEFQKLLKQFTRETRRDREGRQSKAEADIFRRNILKCTTRFIKTTNSDSSIMRRQLDGKRIRVCQGGSFSTFYLGDQHLELNLEISESVNINKYLDCLRYATFDLVYYLETTKKDENVQRRCNLGGIRFQKASLDNLKLQNL